MKKKKMLIPVMALSLGVALGTGLVIHAAATGNADTKSVKTYKDSAMTQEAETYKPEYPTNEDGLTYGADTGMTVAFEDEADLQKVLGDNGIEGYCYKKDLYDLDNQPKSIEEAVKMQEERDAAGNPRRVLNVYESDGKTIIDTFTTG